MNVKTHLKQICDLEQTLKETEMKIPKHKSKKAETEEKINKKRKELENDVAKQQEEIEKLVHCRKSRANYVFKGTKKEKNTTIIVCIVTAIIQAIITTAIAYFFGTDNTFAISIAYTSICTILIVFWLHMEYLMWYKFPYFKTLLGIILLAILYQVLRWYFQSWNNLGINIIGANIFFTLFIISVEIYFGLRACYKAITAQNKEYAKKQKWLSDSEIDLQNMQNELALRKQKLVKFNSTSAVALAKMETDIAFLEEQYAITQKQLKDVYAQNVLHPNYQNWVAAATIYEYLDVGRCYELKGPDGGYNLYEKELIAKKILDSLSAINSSINYYGSSISNSQRYIRNQLSECNSNVERMVINTYGF